MDPIEEVGHRQPLVEESRVEEPKQQVLLAFRFLGHLWPLVSSSLLNRIHVLSPTDPEPPSLSFSRSFTSSLHHLSFPFSSQFVCVYLLVLCCWSSSRCLLQQQHRFSLSSTVLGD